MLSPPGSPGAAAWDECKRRVAPLAARTPNTLAVDFMLPSPITDVGRQLLGLVCITVFAIADRIAHDLAAADRGEASPDYRVLGGDGVD